MERRGVVAEREFRLPDNIAAANGIAKNIPILDGNIIDGNAKNIFDFNMSDGHQMHRALILVLHREVRRQRPEDIFLRVKFLERSVFDRVPFHGDEQQRTDPCNEVKSATRRIVCIALEEHD